MLLNLFSGIRAHGFHVGFSLYRVVLTLPKREATRKTTTANRKTTRLDRPERFNAAAPTKLEQLERKMLA